MHFTLTLSCSSITHSDYRMSMVKWSVQLPNVISSHFIIQKVAKFTHPELYGVAGEPFKLGAYVLVGVAVLDGRDVTGVAPLWVCLVLLAGVVGVVCSAVRFWFF